MNIFRKSPLLELNPTCKHKKTKQMKSRTCKRHPKREKTRTPSIHSDKKPL